MLRSAGFQILQQPEEEVFICRRAERPTAAGAVYPQCPKTNGKSNGSHGA
jgi:tRNA (mo5U34)-methyltransferase